MTTTAAVKQKAERRGDPSIVAGDCRLSLHLAVDRWLFPLCVGAVSGLALLQLHHVFRVAAREMGRTRQLCPGVERCGPVFWKSLWNTTYYVVGMVTLRLVLGFLLALLLNKKVRGITVWRTLFYVPSIVPIVAVSIIWLFILNPKFGLVNYGLSLIGIDGPGWMTSPIWSKPA
ncbi:MAG: hypothetical protein R2851_16575 [Caldilineaceae bacterium]